MMLASQRESCMLKLQSLSRSCVLPLNVPMTFPSSLAMTDEQSFTEISAATFLVMRCSFILSSAGSNISAVMTLPPVRLLKKENIPPLGGKGEREREKERERGGGREQCIKDKHIKALGRIVLLAQRLTKGGLLELTQMPCCSWLLPRGRGCWVWPPAAEGHSPFPRRIAVTQHTCTGLIGTYNNGTIS